MKTRKILPRLACATFVLACSPAARAGAQAPPGPLPQTDPRDPPPNAQSPAPSDVPRSKVLAGSWRLNLDESDDPAKKLQQARGAGHGGAGRRGGYPGGGGWPGGGGRGGYGGRGQNSESDSDREKMHNFLEPARELTITQKDPEIVVSDDRDRKFSFYTDNRKVEKAKDQTHQEFDAKWDQYRLVAEGKDPLGNYYERCYEVLDGNRQLRQTLLLKVGRNNSEVLIRYIYDLASSPAANANKP